jgi:uncharacterized membrane protein YeiH
MHVHELDLIGTFAFAVFGSYHALEKRLNVFGIITCAALTALGGGTIRQLILHRLPVYFTNHAYLYATLAGVVLTVVLYRQFTKIRAYVLVFDAVGLATFSYIGASVAQEAGLGLVGMVFFAALTAAGGGILTDLLVGDRPSAFVAELYILPAAIGGGLYWLLATPRLTVLAAWAILGVPLCMRITWLLYRGRLNLRGLTAETASGDNRV